MIDTTAVGHIVTVLMTCWILGFGMGKSVAWTRALRSAA